jgi:hypothetical protein
MSPGLANLSCNLDQKRPNPQILNTQHPKNEVQMAKRSSSSGGGDFWFWILVGLLALGFSQGDNKPKTAVQPTQVSHYAPR